MVADRLTKALPPQKHANFVRLLGLVDLKDRIQEAEAKKIQDKGT
jgi:hypothetical protein